MIKSSIFLTAYQHLWGYLPDIGMRVRDRGSVPGRVIPKTQNMVLDASLVNTQPYKLGITGKIEQSRERSSAFLYT